jgi:hypothetical protein
MTSTESQTDMGIGLGLLFGLVAVGAAALMAINAYDYAILHAQGGDTSGLLVASGWAFGIAMLTAGLAVMAIHVYDA